MSRIVFISCMLVLTKTISMMFVWYFNLINELINLRFIRHRWWIDFSDLWSFQQIIGPGGRWARRAELRRPFSRSSAVNWLWNNRFCQGFWPFLECMHVAPSVARFQQWISRIFVGHFPQDSYSLLQKLKYLKQSKHTIRNIMGLEQMRTWVINMYLKY